MAYFVYILKSLKTGAYYTGSTQNITERLERHNQGRSKATKYKRPWELVYSEKFESRAEATKREHEIKSKKSKEYINKLINTPRKE